MGTSGESSGESVEAGSHIADVLRRYNLTYVDGQSPDANEVEELYNDLREALTQASAGTIEANS